MAREGTVEGGVVQIKEEGWESEEGKGRVGRRDVTWLKRFGPTYNRQNERAQDIPQRTPSQQGER